MNKKPRKSLRLDRTTLRALTQNQLGNVGGGRTLTDPTQTRPAELLCIPEMTNGCPTTTTIFG